MKLGIVGFPGSGKTTLFNLLTGADAATRRVSRGALHVGVARVPDERAALFGAFVDRLAIEIIPRHKQTDQKRRELGQRDDNAARFCNKTAVRRHKRRRFMSRFCSATKEYYSI